MLCRCNSRRLLITLHQLERFMSVDLHDIGLWEVNDETIERLRFIADRSSSAIFQEALLEAAENIGAGIVHFGKERPLAIGPPTDYTTALARLHESSSEGRTGLPGPDQRKEAWRDVQRLLNQQVVGPVRELALASSNPVERNLLMGFAELSNVFHMQTVVMGEQLNGRIADRGVERGGQLPDDQFKNLMAMADRLIGMARATQRCSQPRTAIIESQDNRIAEFPALAALRLTAGDLEALAVQGFVGEERRGNRTYYKLRFRRAGKQVVRYVGGADRAAIVKEELAHAPGRNKGHATTQSQESKIANKMIREAKQTMEPVLKANGFVFHGLAIRRPRRH